MKIKISWSSWLVLLAIVGVIAAIAIPSYGDYIHRAQASEAVSLLEGAKAPLAEYFDSRKKWPGRLDEVSGTSGKYTSSVAITRGAGGTGEIELTATMRSEGVDRRVAGQSVLMTSADGGKNWTCKPGTMQPKNLPTACRN
ncbi:MAG: pilin [Betaproteobacteria bacterium]